MRTRWKLAVILAALCVGPLSHAQSQSANGSYSGREKVLVPDKGWSCGMPGGIPVPERGAQVFEATMQVDQVYDVGRTPYGQRKVFVIREGTVTGQKLSAAVMFGGLDFELGFANGAMEVEQVFVLKTSDGKFIYMRNAGTAADKRDVRIVPDFEAPNASDYSWLNTGKYVGRRIVDTEGKTVKLTVFDVSGVTTENDTANSLQVTKPSDVLDQPWEHRKAAADEKRGDQLITENVTLSSSQSVGPTKNGARNIIPITGGTLSGKITGKVLPGGADYQKLANPPTLDARYLWQTDDGDVIIVHNAGPIASLVPTFEVRVDSKHAWLNKGTYLSSGPGMGAGGVKLTFYESTQ